MAPSCSGFKGFRCNPVFLQPYQIAVKLQNILLLLSHIDLWCTLVDGKNPNTVTLAFVDSYIVENVPTFTADCGSAIRWAGAGNKLHTHQQLLSKHEIGSQCVTKKTNYWQVCSNSMSLLSCTCCNFELQLQKLNLTSWIWIMVLRTSFSPGALLLTL